MQEKGTQYYRVKAVAEYFDVSVATIYRAIESGELRATKHGTGKGAFRVSEDALRDYKTACERAACVPEVA